MKNSMRVVLSGIQGGRVELDLHFGGRHARLYLDQVTDRYPGQPNDERVNEELIALSEALDDWAKNSRAISTL
jgi:hypothetical protein